MDRTYAGNKTGKRSRKGVGLFGILATAAAVVGAGVLLASTPLVIAGVAGGALLGAAKVATSIQPKNLDKTLDDLVDNKPLTKQQWDDVTNKQTNVKNAANVLAGGASLASAASGLDGGPQASGEGAIETLATGQAGNAVNLVAGVVQDAETNVATGSSNTVSAGGLSKYGDPNAPQRDPIAGHPVDTAVGNLLTPPVVIVTPPACGACAPSDVYTNTLTGTGTSTGAYGVAGDITPATPPKPTPTKTVSGCCP